MRRFALLTAAALFWLACLATMLPAADAYPQAEDEWAPERYASVEDASYEVGYYVPSLHNPPGWRLDGVFVAWRGEQGLVDLTYVSEPAKALLTLSINRRRLQTPYIKTKDEAGDATTSERVRFAGRYAQLVTHRTTAGATMTVRWIRNGLPITATAFMYGNPNGPSLTRHALLEALETLH